MLAVRLLLFEKINYEKARKHFFVNGPLWDTHCHKSSTDRRVLLKHCASIHSLKSLFFCLLCSKEFFAMNSVKISFQNFHVASLVINLQ